MSTPIHASALLGGLLSLLLHAPVAVAQCGAADSFEDNDDCASAAVIAPGLHQGLTCEGSASPGGDDPDYYRVTVGAGEILDATIRFTHQASRDLDMYLLTTSATPCNLTNSVLVSSETPSDDERIIYPNNSGVPVDFVLAVVTNRSGDVLCNTYDLELYVGPDPCNPSFAADDAFEDNDDCASATLLAGAGVWTDLFVSPLDEDFYRVTVPDGEQVSVEIRYDELESELGVALYSDTVCLTLADSNSGGGRTLVSWKNTTGANTDVVFRVGALPNERCNNYDLQVAIAPDPCDIGLNDAYAPNGTCATAAALAPGLVSDLFVQGVIADYFKVTVPGTDILTVDLGYVLGDNGELGIRLYSDAACQNLIDQSAWAATNSVTTGAAIGITTDFYVNVYALGFPTNCNGYDLNISLATDPCVSAIDDGFEQNDTCGTATPLTPGLHPGLLSGLADADVYAVTVQPGERIIGEISYPYGSGATLGLTAFDSACVTQLDNGGGTDGSHVEWANPGGSAVDVKLIVDAVNNQSGGCANYDLYVSVITDPCLSTPDDVFEPNDDCSSAASIGNNTFPGLYVHRYDPDYYRVNLAFGEQLSVQVNYTDLSAQVSLRLYEAFPQQGGTCGDGTNSIASGFGPTGTKQLDWTNDIVGGDYFVEVTVASWSQADCTTYDLDISDDGIELAEGFCYGDGTADVGQGMVGCPCGNNSQLGSKEGCANSQGHGATLEATGSTSIALDNLLFHVDQARPNQPSLLVQGASLVAFPFKDGILCMGNPTERVEIVMLDSAGAGSTAESVITNGNVAPGDTRYYQQWYRDPQLSPCGSGSNFTHGLRVDWMP